jgi:hypothetical protein
VYDAAYESAGGFWPFVHGRIIAALVIEHLMLIGIFLVQGPVTFGDIPADGSNSTVEQILTYVREVASATPFMIALPVFTLVFHRYCKNRFEPCFANMPLEVPTRKLQPPPSQYRMKSDLYQKACETSSTSRRCLKGQSL